MSAPEAVSVTGVPEHKLALFTVTKGLGFTVIVNVIEEPVQPLSVGVTVIVAVIGAPELLFTVKDGIFPDPEEASPMAVLLLVQL